jgi:hypothetical protein
MSYNLVDGFWGHVRQPGDPGTAVLDVTITGAFGQSGSGTSSASVAAFDSVNRVIDSVQLVSPGTYRLSIPMTFDQPFDYKLSLFAVSQTDWHGIRYS